MATLKRGDILRKNTSRGRPPKPEKERQQKQRQAYQWRDARRVYLAASFERWRKLRARLQLKDSSLAWHLLETHDKGCDKCNGIGSDGGGGDAEGGASSVMDVHVQPEKDASKFFPGVKAALRQLCHAHLQFEECVELVGLLCVEIDHRRKDNFSVQEIVRRGIQPKARAHERDQSVLEATQAQAVAAALSRQDLGSGRSQSDSDSHSGMLEDSMGEHAETQVYRNTEGSQDCTSMIASDFEQAQHSGSTENATQAASSHGDNSGVTESQALRMSASPADSNISSEEKNSHLCGTVPSGSSDRRLNTVSVHNKEKPAIPATGNSSAAKEEEKDLDNNSMRPEVLTGDSHHIAKGGETAYETDQSLLTRESSTAEERDGSTVLTTAYSHVVPGLPGETGVAGSATSDSSRRQDSETRPQYHPPTHHQTLSHRHAHHREQVGGGVSVESVAPPRVVVSPDGVVHVPRACGVTGEVYRIDLSGEPREDVPWPTSSRRDAGDCDGRSVEQEARSPDNDETDSGPGRSLSTNVTSMDWEGTEHGQPSGPVPSSRSSHYEVMPSQSTKPSTFSPAASTADAAAVKSETADAYQHNTELPTTGSGGGYGAVSTGDSGDVPLDMSVVKEEADYEMSDDHQQTRDGNAQGQISANSLRGETTRNARPASVPLDTSLTSTSSLYARRQLSPSPGGSSSWNARISSRDGHLHRQPSSTSPVSPPVSASSMQLLQNYTERLMQQRMTGDLPSHSSARMATPMSDSENGQGGGASRKRRLSEAEERMEMTGGVSPWPRKDMTQKPEYQFLETDPFIDFGEMSRFYPSMQQRTFYRWKRRIKDQIIFLEQRPHLTYSQFSAFFPHVKENVFHHWRGLIARGQRFLADSSKTGGAIGLAGDSPAPLPETSQSSRNAGGGAGSAARDAEERGEGKDDHTAQFIFLQKNIGLDLEQFAQVYPDVPRHLFHTWKKQILSDFLKLQANPQISYQEFRKQAPVTQDVFSLWKTQVALLNGGSPVTSSCLGLTPTPLSTMAPTLPPMSLLAARPGMKNVGAELAAWYSSYAPLMGLPLWPPLGMMPGGPLPTSTIAPTLRELGEDRERAAHVNADPAQSSNGRAERETAADDIREEAEDEENDVSADVDSAPSARASSPHADGSVGAGSGAGYRGRRQSLKPEHYHFLLHPDTSYTALSRIYPGVSVQRYGRWRRKVSSALALLERQPHCTSEQFALYFPNVPDEILESWRQRVKQGLAQLPLGSLDAGADSTPAAPPTSTATPSSPSSATGDRRSRDSSLSAENVSEEMPNFLMESGEGSASESRGRAQESGLPTTAAGASPVFKQSASSSAGSTRKQVKLSREEYHFVQRYPKVDFATFTTYYPTVSIRTFYRWRRQIREGISLLRSEPSISGVEFRKVFPDVSDDVLEAWRALVREEEGSGADTNATSDQAADPYSDQPASPEEQVDVTGVSRDKVSPAGSLLSTSPGPTEAEIEREESGRCRAEQWLLHMNPYLDYPEFCRNYPGVPQRTFYRWKQEVQQVMHYMRTHPDVRYDDIAAVLPDISRDAFGVWNRLIAAEARDARAPSEGHGTGVVGDPSETATAGESQQHHRAATVTSESAYTAHAGAASRGGSSGGSHQSSDTNQTLDRQAEVTAAEASTCEEEEAGVGRGRRQVRDEFVHVMLNPAMDYAEFSIRFGTVSQRTFYRWRRHIREWRALIRANPGMDYPTFSRNARDVPEAVFRVWREWECGTEQRPAAGTHTDGQETALHAVASSFVGSDESAREGVAATSNPAYPHSSHVPQTEDVSLDGQPPDDSPNDSSDSENHQVAYQYFLRQPEMTFEDLSAHYPMVAPRTFYSWKKSAEMKLEYIRSIRSTNFADFHSLFPDVPEDVFLIWKAKVLSEPRPGDNFLFPVGDEPQALSAYPSHLGAPFASPLKQQDSRSTDTDTSGRRSPGGSPVQPAYTGPSLSSQSPRQRVSPAPAARDAEKVGSEATLNIKREADTTPLPSFTETVSNLSRLSAMLHHHLPQHSAPPAPVPVHPHLLPADPHASVIAGTTGLANFSTALAGVVGRTLADNASSIRHHFPQQQQALDMASSHASSDSAAYSSPHDSRPARAPPSDARAGHEDKGGEGTVYSSQRQRKMHRVEYMFVEKSPDVDVQEFLRRFPGVSPRTFYRWKREIREEQQAAGGGGGST